MIEPKSTDIGREVLHRSDQVRGIIDGFDHLAVHVRFTADGAVETLEREALVWADIAAALARFAAAGLKAEPEGEDALRVADCLLYWPRSGMFERRDGSKGSGGEDALVRYIKGLPPIPAVSASSLIRPECTFARCPNASACTERCRSPARRFP